MANAQPGGDVSQRGPAEYLDPLAPLSSQFEQFRSMLELVFDDYEAFLQDLTEDILALPPDERFTESHEVLQEHIEAQFGGSDVFAAVLPESDPSKLPGFLNQVFDTILTDVLEGVFFEREPDEHLILAALFQTLKYSIQRLDETDEQETRTRLASTMLALISRLQDTIAGTSESLPAAVVWDTAYALHYTTADDTGPTFPNPEELSFKEATDHVVAFGAVIAYARLHISVSRGAELAGLAPNEFRAKLGHYGIDPRHGPTSVDDLYDDTIDE